MDHNVQRPSEGVAVLYAEQDPFYPTQPRQELDNQIRSADAEAEHEEARGERHMGS